MGIEKLVFILKEYHDFDVSDNYIKTLVNDLSDVYASREDLIIKICLVMH